MKKILLTSIVGLMTMFGGAIAENFLSFRAIRDVLRFTDIVSDDVRVAIVEALDGHQVCSVQELMQICYSNSGSLPKCEKLVRQVVAAHNELLYSKFETGGYVDLILGNRVVAVVSHYGWFAVYSTDGKLLCVNPVGDSKICAASRTSLKGFGVREDYGNGKRIVYELEGLKNFKQAHFLDEINLSQTDLAALERLGGAGAAADKDIFRYSPVLKSDIQAFKPTERLWQSLSLGELHMLGRARKYNKVVEDFMMLQDRRLFKDVQVQNIEQAEKLVEKYFINYTGFSDYKSFSDPISCKGTCGLTGDDILTCSFGEASDDNRRYVGGRSSFEIGEFVFDDLCNTKMSSSIPREAQ